MIDDLVYDIGMNNGDDTEKYLARGFRVVAIEANPILVESGTKRFSKAINEGRLAIESCAIFNQQGKTQFWINDEEDLWSALDREVSGRDGMSCHAITVPCTRLSKIFATTGTRSAGRSGRQPPAVKANGTRGPAIP